MPGRSFYEMICMSQLQIGTIIAPFIVDLAGDVNPNFPPAIFGAMMIASSFVFLFLPESRGQTLVQTVDELKGVKGRTLSGDLRRAIKVNETAV